MSKFNTILLILGGGNHIDGHFPEHAQNRVRDAMKFYGGLSDQERNETLIVFSGNRCPRHDVPPPNTEAHTMYNLFVSEFELNEEQYMLEEFSRNTLENAFFVTEILKDRQITPKDVHIFTSDFHINRVELIFENILLPKIATQLNIHGATCEKIDEDNLADKISNEHRGIRRFKLFLEMHKPDMSLLQLFYLYKDTKERL